MTSILKYEYFLTCCSTQRKRSPLNSVLQPTSFKACCHLTFTQAFSGMHCSFNAFTLVIHWLYIGYTLVIHWLYIGYTLDIHWLYMNQRKYFENTQHCRKCMCKQPMTISLKMFDIFCF